MNDEEMHQMMRDLDKEIDTAFFNLNYCIGYIEAAYRQHQLSVGNFEDLVPKLQQITDTIRRMR